MKKVNQIDFTPEHFFNHDIFFLAEESDPDTMEEIDTDNIINDGRRTRGLVVDFVAANKDAGNELDDDDEDEDDDFHEDDDAMEE